MQHVAQWGEKDKVRFYSETEPSQMQISWYFQFIQSCLLPASHISAAWSSEFLKKLDGYI